MLNFDGGDAWFIDASVGCDNAIFGGSSTIPAEDIQTETGAAERDFTLGLTAFEAWFYQGIQDERNPVYNVQTDVQECGVFGCGAEEHEECDVYQDETVSGAAETRIEDLAASRLYCFRTVRVGSAADLSLAQGSDFQGTMAAEAGGNRATDVISKNDAAAAINVGDVNGDGDSEHARITWTGSFIGDLRNIDLSGYHVTCDNECEQPTEDVSWTVADTQFYQSWLEFNNNGFEQCLQDNLDEGQDLEGCVNSYNAQASNVFLDAAGAVESRAGFAVDEVRTQGGEVQVVAERGEAVERPDFRILVDTDWIGFDIPVADPVIFQPDDINLVGNGQATAGIEVRNGADLGGEIQLTADCESPVSGGSDTKVVGAGEIEQFRIDLFAGPSDGETVSCELTALDTDDATSAYTETLTVDVQASCIDSDGDGVCDQFDACPDESGIASNNGCSEETDTGDDGNSGGWFTGAVQSVFDAARSVVPGTPGRLPVEGLLMDMAQGIDRFVQDVRDLIVNPFGDWNQAVNVGTVLVAFVLGFQVTRLALVEPFVESVSGVFGVAAPLVLFGIGTVAGVILAWIVYSLIASLWAKILLVLIILGVVGAWTYIQAVTPGGR